MNRTLIPTCMRGSWLAIIPLFLTLSACGSGSSSSTIVASSAQSRVDEHTLPANSTEGEQDSPIEAYKVDSNGGAGGGADGVNVLIQFNGGNIQQQNSIVLQQMNLSDVTIPRFEAADLGDYFKSQNREALIADVMQTVENRYRDLQINFATDPTSFGQETYTTVYVGGDNFTPVAQLLGVSPLDIDNFSTNDILYVFSQQLRNQTTAGAIDMLVNSVTHELNHSFGARHIDSQEANLNPEIYTYTRLFDVEGPRLDNGQYRENTKDVLLNNIGGRDAPSSSTLGLVSNLNIHKQNDIGQISPMFRQRGINQRQLIFEWIDEDTQRKWRGRVLRLDFKEPGFKNIRLNIYKGKEEQPLERYLYRIGR